MKERPILFNDEMVRAILDGRKTQTRRVVKLKTGDTFDEHALVAAIQEWRPMYDEVAGRVVGKQAALIRCPYGQPGDQLWVREAFRSRRVDNLPGEVAYRADHPGEKTVPGSYGRPWKPSIHMPRWACRLRLEVTAVRVERLQDISREDAEAEGLKKWPHKADFAWGYEGGREAGHGSPTGAFRALWESINGAGTWANNPWVWVVEFQRVDSEVPS